MTLQTVPLDKFPFEEVMPYGFNVYWNVLTFSAGNYYTSVPLNDAAQYFPRLSDKCREELKQGLRRAMETVEDTWLIQNPKATHYSDGSERNAFRDFFTKGIGGPKFSQQEYDALKSLYEML